MVCLDYGMGLCKPTWSKVGMEITPGELNKVFLAKDGLSSAHSLGSGWDNKLFFLGLTFVIAVVIYLWISKRMKQQDNDASREKLPEDKRLHEKILVRMGKVEERIKSLEEFVRQSKRAKAKKIGDQRDSD